MDAILGRTITGGGKKQSKKTQTKKVSKVTSNKKVSAVRKDKKQKK